MANVNKVFLLFSPKKSKEPISLKYNKALNKGNNIFQFFNAKTGKEINNNRKGTKNNNKNILTSFSYGKGKLKIFTDLESEYNYMIKRRGIKIKTYIDTKKKININNLFHSRKRKEQDEENKNLNPVFKIKKDEEKSRNKLILNDENTYMTSKTKKLSFFTNETFTSFNKDLFNIKINLKNSKNFSLYKKRLKQKKNTQVKSSITEYTFKTPKIKDKKPLSNNKLYQSFRTKTKYIFSSQESFPTTKFNGLPENVKQMNKYYMNSVKLETDKYFGNNFSILRKEQFSAKFRNPLLNNNFLGEKNLIKEEKYKEIKEDIISGKSILNEINLGKIKSSKRKYLTSIKYIYFKFKNWLIKFAEFCKILEIKPFKYIDLYYKFFHIKDVTFYENQNTKTSELIKAIKTKNLIATNQLITQYPTILLSKDYFEYSPLHWAVKTKFIEIIPNLIIYGSNPNAINYLGETSLHLSVKNNDYESTVLLLIFMANPFIKNNKGKKPFDCMDDYQMNIIKEKIINLYYTNTFKKNKIFVNTLQNKFIDFIMDEFSTQISKETLDIIDQISIRINNGKNKDKK